MYKYAEIISLVLTFVTLQMCLEVAFIWWGEAKQFIQGHREPWLWAGFGILIHFLSAFGDNLYWGIAWSFHFMDSDLADWWFRHGVFSNIPFRQAGTTIAAFCYVRAGYLFEKKHMGHVYHRMIISLCVGVAYVYFLWV